MQAKEKERKEAEKERVEKIRVQEKEKVAKEKEKAQQIKEQEREKVQQIKEKEREKLELLKEKQKDQIAKEKEKVRLAKEREKEKREKERGKKNVEAEKKREQIAKAKAEKEEKPKRARSAYTYFFSEHMGILKQQNPSDTIPALAKKCGEQWKALEAQKKEKFLKLANDDKQRATRDRQNYIKTHPKRPMSGYMLFCQEFRKEIKEKEPNLSLTEVSVKAGHKWKQLSDAEKKKNFPRSSCF